jgi:hypothetical protein
MSQRPLFAVLAVTVALAGTAPARAEFPYPKCGGPLAPTCTDPADYESYLFLPTTNPPTIPSDLSATNFRFSSLVDPAVPPTAQELFGVRGPSVDKAWQLTTGRPDVVIAILDSGIKWHDVGSMADLANKVHLNQNELPLPEATTTGYDRNSDGVFNVRDYLADGTHAQDSRVSDQNGNGLIDPEDLIKLFSDGIDTDGNGYIDDIAGWDFHQEDNDPFDDVDYGHGTGEAKDSNAEAANGGDVGTAPSGMFIPIKVADSFVSDLNDFARGVVFGVDSGAAVIQEANGALDNTAFAQQAINYAWAKGVPVIASAADEESYHHNYPSNDLHTIPVNSVRGQDGDFVQDKTYLLLNGCTNYGAHNVHVSIPSSSCSSEATGRGSGIAALLIAQARNLIDRGLLTAHPITGTALSANEVKQLLAATADDIDFAGNLALSTDPSVKIGFLAKLKSTRFPSHAGRDKYFGYGRVNADQAVRAVTATSIPPEADLLTPGWFQNVDPTLTPAVTIVGSTAAYRRGQAYSYTLEYGCGVDPVDGEYARAGHLIASGAPGVAIVDATLGTWTLGGVSADCAFNAITLPVADRDQYDEVYNVTLRLRVTDDLLNVGEDTRVVSVHHDPDVKPGFPVFLQSSGESSPALADLNGDGKLDVVIATADGRVHALDASGAELPGWPVTTDLDVLHGGSAAFLSAAVSDQVHESVVSSVAVGDLERDGSFEVVVASTQGKLYVFSSTGVARPGFPVSTTPAFSDPAIRNEANRLDPGFLASPALADLDHDDSLEIVIGAMDRHLYVWRADGTPQPGFPILMVDRSVTTVAPNGQVTWDLSAGQPVGSIGTKIVGAPAIGDIDGDGDLEIVQGTNEEYVRGEAGNVQISPFANQFGIEAINGRVYAIAHDGTLSPRVVGNPAGPYLPGWPVKIGIILDDLLPTVGHGVGQQAALGDLDGDGADEIVVQGSNGPLYVLRGNGSSFYGVSSSGKHLTLDYDVAASLPTQSGSNDFPLVLGLLGGPSLADLSGDGRLEVVAGTSGTIKLIDAQASGRQDPGDHQISVWDTATGHMLPTFPQIVEDLMFFGNPTVADLDGDGRSEVVSANGGGFVHAFGSTGSEPVGWPKFTNGWMIPIPVVGDIDGDGLLEVVAMGREGYLTMWDTVGAATLTSVQWNGRGHDRQRTGAVRSGVPMGLVPAACSAGVYRLDLKSAQLKKGKTPGTDKMKVTAGFHLAGNVIAPGSEDVAVSLSGATTAYNGLIPGGSLIATKQGFKFKGSVSGGGEITLKLTSKYGVTYKLAASAKTFSAGVGPLVPRGTVTLRIGQDCFELTVPCALSGGGSGQVCKPPR